MRKFVVSGRTSPPQRSTSAFTVFVDLQVGPAEAVDALLGVADDEQLAWREAYGAPVQAESGSARGLADLVLVARKHTISACSGSVSWNSSTRMKSNFAGSSGEPASSWPDVAGLEQQVLEVRECRSPCGPRNARGIARATRAGGC